MCKNEKAEDELLNEWWDKILMAIYCMMICKMNVIWNIFMKHGRNETWKRWNMEEMKNGRDDRKMNDEKLLKMYDQDYPWN